MASIVVEEFGRYCAVVFRVRGGPAPAVVVQGPDAPYLLSAFHPFEGDAHIGKVYSAFLHLPDELVECRVHHISDEHDFILFRMASLVDRYTAPVDVSPSASQWGRAYILLGYSACYRVQPNDKWCLTWASTMGHIASSILDTRCVAASGGSVPGDSGGPVFSLDTKKLIAINLAVTNIHPCWSIDEAARARVSPQGAIKPLWIMEDFLRAKTGGKFFGPGGTRAFYAPQPAISTAATSSTQQGVALELALRAPRHPQETLCESSFAELFDPDLLDPYKF